MPYLEETGTLHEVRHSMDLSPLTRRVISRLFCESSVGKRITMNPMQILRRKTYGA
jgi:hypothetical protein